jgi:hypothetical protein
MDSGSRVDTIDYLTIDTSSNASDFGNLTQARQDAGACSDGTKAVWGGGYYQSPLYGVNIIDYVTISSTGNASDFGDLTADRSGVSSCSGD